jgi:hypothetical protein
LGLGNDIIARKEYDSIDAQKRHQQQFPDIQKMSQGSYVELFC